VSPVRLVADGDLVAGEEAAMHGALGQYLWWITLPGMNWRARSAWPSPEIANTICAAACIIRLAEIAGPGSRVQKLFSDIRRFRVWLDEAEGDEAAFQRRIILCLLMGIATARTEPQHLVEYAKTLIKA
jgi:hypothetical protein